MRPREDVVAELSGLQQSQPTWKLIMGRLLLEVLLDIRELIRANVAHAGVMGIKQ